MTDDIKFLYQKVLNLQEESARFQREFIEQQKINQALSRYIEELLLRVKKLEDNLNDEEMSAEDIPADKEIDQPKTPMAQQPPEPQIVIKEMEEVEERMFV